MTGVSRASQEESTPPIQLVCCSRRGSVQAAVREIDIRPPREPLKGLKTESMSAASTPRRRPAFPGSLTDLHRFRKTAHGHDGSSRIVMVRKTDQRTFASIKNGEGPKLETITRETIETFRGQRTECKFTTEKKDYEETCPPDLIEALTDRATKTSKRPSLKAQPGKALTENLFSRSAMKRNVKMEFQQECLQAHNEYRRKHGVPPLKLNREMCRLSQEWANNLIKKNALQHSNNREYGENLFCIQSTNPHFTISGKEVVDNWYEEIKCHKFGVEPSSLSSGHFTQVVWKDSKELGVAFAKTGGKIVVVANYSPSGNIIGHFAENVLPPDGLHATNNNNIELTNGTSKLSINAKVTHRLVQNVTEGNFEEDFLEAHNTYRRRHGVLPLKLDRKLCRYSEEWARHLAAKNILEHRPGSNYGENIYCLYSSDPNFTVNGHTPVDTWYEEVNSHPFGKEPSNLKSGHFSQMVWKASEALGVGVAKNSQGSIYVVANYSPAGNFVGHYIENVPPVKPAFYGEVTRKNRYEQIVEYPEEDVTDHQGGFSQFALDALRVHNEYRRKHGVPELTLSLRLCQFAQDWADTCAKTSSLQHRANCPYGENIFSVYSSDFSHTPTARDAIKEWYDEVKQHNFGVERVNQGTLHFTQVIWKSSRELGIGIAKNKRGQTYVVANYDPRGNYIGQFVENVPRPKP